MLNMNQIVHPYQWDLDKFVEFDRLTPSQEFDLIAPVAIYFQADVCFKDKARKAWNKLRALDHPVAASMAASEMVKEMGTPDGIHERYKALFMFLCRQEWPSAEFTVDQYGGLAVKKSGDAGDDEMSGDGQGEYPWFESSSLLLDRLKMKVEA